MYNVINMPDLVSRFFSSNLWLVTFLVSIIYLFFRQKSAGKRAILAAVAIFLLVINSFVIRQFTALGENDTFYRHLWAIPSTVIIGIAIVDLIIIIPRWFLKIPVIIAVFIFLWFANEEYIRCRFQILSADANMVQEDVITLSEGFDNLRKESDKNTLFVVCPTGYTIPYGDMVSELSLYSGYLDISGASILNSGDRVGDMELSAEVPDVPYIMSTCCSKGIDYVIVSRKENTEQVFLDQNYNAVIKSDSFLVYKCYGYEGYTHDKTNWGQISRISYHNEKDEPELIAEGYSVVLYTYDGKGNRIKEQYYGTDGVPCIISSGYSGIEFEYNSKHMCTKETYIDDDGKACNLNAGYASIVRKYTSNSLLESLMYVGADGKPILMNGCYETRYAYDSKKHIISEAYYDADGMPMIHTDRQYSSEKTEYDLKNRVSSQRYFDTEGNLVLNNKGFAGYTRQYDDNNRLIRETYFGTDEKPIRIYLGYATLERFYDEDGNIAGDRFLDENGNAVSEENRYAEYRREYNKAGQLIRESFWKSDGSPFVLPYGYHAYTREYDGSGNLEKETYYDADNNIVKRDLGYAEIEWSYDDNDRIIKESYHDENKKLVLGPDGFAILMKYYDDKGNQIEERYFDENGNPVE